MERIVTSEASIIGIGSSIGLGAILSIPLGIGVAFIPPLIFVAGGTIASMFIPSFPAYQRILKKRKERLVK